MQNPLFPRVLRACCACGVVCLAFVAARATLSAQDVTVTSPAFFDNADAGAPPDSPPTLRKKWKPDFPDEMRKATDPGYVIITQYIDEKGQRRWFTAAGSVSYYEGSVRDAYSDLQNKPAQKEGKSIASYSWMAAIYNPSGAAEKDTDATPRLLKVMPILVSGKQFDAFPKGPKVLPGSVVIDASGVAKDIRLASAASYAQAVLPEIERSVSQWQFAPARKDGQPVEAPLNLIFVVQVAPNPKAKVVDNTKPPEPISRAAPVYPFKMKASGLVGEVTIQFIISKTGAVTSTKILRSNNPGFEQAAIDAVMKWKFKPGIVDGKPVNTRMQIPIAFHLDGDDNGAGYTSETPSRKKAAEMPEGLRYDVPPKARGVIYPVYPYQLFKDGKSGKAVVGVLVDARGVVADIGIIEASAPEFGEAAVAACEYFEFDAALLDGKPTNAIIRLTLEFNDDAIFMTQEDKDALRLEKKSPEKIFKASQLDAQPKPISIRDAPFPVLARNAGIEKGEAVIEFLIDKDGRVRLPRIVSSTHPSFGYVAVQTVANWRFEPPLSGGKPVVVRARIPVSFKTNDTPAAKS